MSTLYKTGREVPSAVLADRLDELSDVVAGHRGRISDELTMRIPAELDRDADLVFAEAARRLREKEKALEDIVAWVDRWTTNGHPVSVIALAALSGRVPDKTDRAGDGE